MHEIPINGQKSRLVRKLDRSRRRNWNDSEAKLNRREIRGHNRSRIARLQCVAGREIMSVSVICQPSAIDLASIRIARRVTRVVSTTCLDFKYLVLQIAAIAHYKYQEVFRVDPAGPASVSGF